MLLKISVKIHQASLICARDEDVSRCVILSASPSPTERGLAGKEQSRQLQSGPLVTP